jgi:hypothetical protein
MSTDNVGPPTGLQAYAKTDLFELIAFSTLSLVRNFEIQDNHLSCLFSWGPASFSNGFLAEYLQLLFSWLHATFSGRINAGCPDHEGEEGFFRR